MNLNNSQLGDTISRLRKEKGLTQKQLGDKLFVTDKTVSKWERGISMPNIFLLIPLSEALGVSTEELLRGEFKTSIVRKMEVNKRLWIVLSIFSALSCAVFNFLLFKKGFDTNLLRNDVGLISILTLAFGFYFSCFVKPVLPSYYDTNRIGYYTDGFMKLNMPFISFNNSNWFYICRYIKAYCLITAAIYPLCALLAGERVWAVLSPWPLLASLIVLVIGIYIIAYKQK